MGWMRLRGWLRFAWVCGNLDMWNGYVARMLDTHGYYIWYLRVNGLFTFEMPQLSVSLDIKDDVFDKWIHFAYGVRGTYSYAKFTVWRHDNSQYQQSNHVINFDPVSHQLIIGVEHCIDAEFIDVRFSPNTLALESDADLMVADTDCYYNCFEYCFGPGKNLCEMFAVSVTPSIGLAAVSANKQTSSAGVPECVYNTNNFAVTGWIYDSKVDTPSTYFRVGNIAGNSDLWGQNVLCIGTDESGMIFAKVDTKTMEGNISTKPTQLTHTNAAVQNAWTFIAAGICGADQSFTLCTALVTDASATCVSMSVPDTLKVNFTSQATIYVPDMDSTTGDPSLSSDITFRMNYCYTASQLQGFFTESAALCLPGCLWCGSPFSCLNITNTHQSQCFYFGVDCMTCSNPAGCQSCRAGMHLTGLTPNNCTCDDTFYPSPDGSHCSPCDVSCLTCLGNAANDCTSCFPNAEPATLPCNSTVPCACACSSGTVPRYDISKCSCYPACASCTGASNSQCVSCSSHATLTATNTCNCNLGYYPDEASHGCPACAATCASCSGGAATDCLTCHSSATKQADGSCVCNSGYYWNSGTKTCNACHITCQTCAGVNSNECLTCKAGAELPAGASQGVCSCVSGRIPSPDARSCACDVTCKTCQTTAASDCLSCYANAALPVGSSMGVCSCIAGFVAMPDASSCSCNAKCATCSGSTSSDCTSCPSHSHSSAGQCLSDDYYYWDGTSFSACHPTCKSCTGTSDTQCTACSSGAALSGTPQKCKCSTGFYPNPTAAVCGTCSATCVTCFGASTVQCLTCYSHASLVSYQCLCDVNYYPAPTVASCAACDTSCKTCRDNSATGCISCNVRMHISASSSCVCDTSAYLVSAGNCQPCAATCLSCASSSASTDCQSCFSGAKLAGAAPSSCTCDSGYYTYTNSANCQPCHYSCATCTLGPAASQCATCKPNSHMTGTAPNTCVCNDQTYVSASGSCELCDSTCLTCSAAGSAGCTSCPSPSTLVGGACVCAVGYFVSGTTCAPCSAECLTCSSSSSSGCVSCKENSHLLSLSPSSCLCELGYRRVDASGYCVKCRVFFTSVEVKGYIDETYSKLVLEFARAVDISSLVTCDTVFPTETIARFGANPKCIWSADRKSLAVVLGVGYLLRAETIKLITRNIGGESDACVTIYTDFTVSVTFKATKAPPVAVINAPKAYSTACETSLRLSAAGSLGLGGQPAVFKWSLLFDPGLFPLQDYSQFSSSNIAISLSNSQLLGTRMNATLTVRDYWGQEGTTTVSVSVLDKPGIDVYLNVLSPVSVRRSESVEITAAAVLLCVSDKSQAVNYLWELTETSPAGNSLNFLSYSSSLSIPSNSLSLSVVYTFRLTVSTVSLSASTSVLLSATSSPLQVILDNCDSQHSSSEDLQLSAASSYDPDFPSTPLSFVWTCLEGTGVCLDGTGNRLPLAATASMAVSKNLIRIGAKYTFTVTASLGEKTKSASVTIEVVNSQGASVRIQSSTLRVAPNQPVTVSPTVDSTAFLSFQWTQTGGKPLVLATSLSSQWLKIPEGQVETGEVYRFSLFVSAGILSNVTISANLSPSLGNLVSNPSSGTAVSTVFSLEALTWVDPDGTDYPLSYRFGTLSPSSVYWLSLPQLRYQFSALLYTGALTAVVEVCDAIGGCSNATTTVFVEKPTSSPSLAEIETKMAQEWISPLATMTAYALTYVTLADQNFLEQLITRTNSFFFAQSEVDNYVLSAHISLLTSFTTFPGLLTTGNISKLLASLSSSLSRLQSSLSPSNRAAALQIIANASAAQNMTQDLINFSNSLQAKVETVPGEQETVVKGALSTFVTRQIVASSAASLNMKVDKLQIEFPEALLNETSLGSNSVCELRILQQNSPSDVSATVSVSLTQVRSYVNYALSSYNSNPVTVQGLTSPVNLTIPLNKYDVGESLAAFTKAESAEKWTDFGVNLTKINGTSAVIAVSHFSSFKVDKRERLQSEIAPWATLQPKATPTCTQTFSPVILAAVQLLALLTVWTAKKLRVRPEKFSPTEIVEPKESRKTLKASPVSSAKSATSDRHSAEPKQTESTPNFSARKFEIEDWPKERQVSFWRKTVEFNPVLGGLVDRKHVLMRLLVLVSLFVGEELALGVANLLVYSDWKQSDIPNFVPSSWSSADYISCAAVLGFGLCFSLFLQNVYTLIRTRRFLKRAYIGVALTGAAGELAVIAWLCTRGCDQIMNLWTAQTVAVAVTETVAGGWVSGGLSAAARGVSKKDREEF